MSAGRKSLVQFYKSLNIPVMLYGVVILMLLFGVLTNWRNFTVPNMVLVLRNSSVLLLAAVGMTMVILVSQVDLSIGSVMSLSGAITAIALKNGYGTGAAIAMGLACGVFVGFVNGVLVAVMKLDYWISTFATMGICAGLALVVAGGGTVPIRNQLFRVVGSGKLFGVHYMVYATILIILFIGFVLKRTRFGYNIYSIGGSEQAAALSGISIVKNRIAVFVASGFFAAVAGLIQASMTSSANPNVGITYSFDAMAAVIIGGTGFDGGKGGIYGTALGAVILRILAHGLAIMGIPSTWQKAIIGIVIVAVLVADAVNNTLRRKKDLRRVYTYRQAYLDNPIKALAAAVTAASESNIFKPRTRLDIPETLRSARLEARGMPKSGPSLRFIVENYSRPIILVIIVAALALLRPASFWTWSNISTVVFQQAPFTMLMSFGMTFAIITKGIDKSMGSVLVISSVIAAHYIKGGEIAAGIAVALAIGAFCGIVNGLLITRMGIFPFIATYGVDFVAIGAAYVYTGGASIYGFPDSFRDLARGQTMGVTNLALVTFAIFLVLHFPTTKTTFGRRMYSSGFNEAATALSGNSVHFTLTAVYMINGLLAAIAGILYMARLNAADPGISGNFTLDSIAAALVGGTSFGGGKGSMTNAVVGALIIVFIRNGMNIMGVHSNWQQTAVGFIILFSVVLEFGTRFLLTRLEKDRPGKSAEAAHVLKLSALELK